jgi:hypothetical protein
MRRDGADRPAGAGLANALDVCSMGLRFKKFVGTLLLLLFVAAYAFAMMMVAAAVLPHGSKALELGFYAVAGFLWVLPAGLLISWMHRQPDRPADGAIGQPKQPATTD